MPTNSDVHPGSVVKIMHYGVMRVVTVARIGVEHGEPVFDFYLTPPDVDGRWGYIDEIIEVIKC